MCILPKRMVSKIIDLKWVPTFLFIRTHFIWWGKNCTTLWQWTQRLKFPNFPVLCLLLLFPASPPVACLAFCSLTAAISSPSICSLQSPALPRLVLLSTAFPSSPLISPVSYILFQFPYLLLLLKFSSCPYPFLPLLPSPPVSLPSPPVPNFSCSSLLLLSLPSPPTPPFPSCLTTFSSCPYFLLLVPPFSSC